MNVATSVREATPADEPVPSAVTAAPVAALLASLAARRVRYCHWKSNVRLPESLAGDEDLDLLVAPADDLPFFAALADSGFKLAKSRAGVGHPGVFHAFALDPATLRLMHVHAYFQVVSGDSIVKSFRLPFEARLLDGTRREQGVPVPAAEVELVVFLLRIALKHTGIAETMMVNRNYGPVPGELAWLRERADEGAARALWQACVSGAGPDEFDEVVRAVAEPAAVAHRVRLGLWLSWRLRSWRRLGHPAAIASRLRRLALLFWWRMRRRRPLGLVSGGAIVALVGPKATGKSTLAGALDDRLGKQLRVRRIHVGKPPPTLLTAPMRLVLPLLRRLMPGERSGEYQRAERRAEMRYSMAYILRMVIVAHERRVLLKRAHRDACGGTIVITDRYPSADVGASDSSQFGSSAIAGSGSPLKRLLMRVEQGRYVNLPTPDLVVRLAAPIETTLTRDACRIKREGPDPETVKRRRDIETASMIPGAPILEVSTERSLEQTIAEVVTGVWRRL